MADERPIHQDDELPAWLRGHIQPEPGAESRPRPAADAASPEDIAAAFELPVDLVNDVGGEPGGQAAAEETGAPAGETLPWGTDEGADVNLPAAKDLKGLTGQLPWLSDVVSGPGSPSPADEEADADVLDWLAAEEPEPGEPARTPGLMTGLTGELPWLDESGLPGANEDVLGAGGLSDSLGSLGDEDLDWLAGDDTPSETPSIRRLQAETPAETPSTGTATPDWLGQAEPEDEPPATPDWLAAAEEFLTEDEQAAPAANLPDWLAQAGPAAEEEAPAEPSTPVPDWLAVAEGLAEETPAAAAPPEPGTTDGTPEWLAIAEEFAAADSEEAAAEEAPGEPEWLIRDTGELAPEEQPEDSGVGYDEWMAAQAEEERQPTAEEQLAEEVPDWFGEIGAEAPADEGAPSPAAPAGGEAEFVPDWYLGLEEQDASAMPDWFDQSSLSADMLTAAPEIPEAPAAPEPMPEPPAATPAEASAEAAGAELPDWFADIQPEEAAAPSAADALDLDALFGEEPPPVGAPSTTGADEIDFDMLLGETPELPAVGADELDFDMLMGETPESPTAGADEIDFAMLMGEVPAAEAPGGAAPQGEAESDWMADFEAAGAPPAAPKPSADMAPGDVPDWLGAIAPEDMAAAEVKAAEESIAAGDDDFMRLIEQELGGQDPLAGLGLGSSGAVISEGDAKFDLDALLADQAADLPSRAGAADEDAAAAAAMGEAGRELPDWLLDAKPGPGGGVGFSAVNLALRQPEVPVEELSDRLRALRERSAEVAQVDKPPVESAPLSSQDVLAELPGALTPADLRAGGEPEVALSLSVSDAQQARVQRLESMLGLDVVPTTPALDEDGQPIAVDQAKENARIRAAARRARARSRRKPDRFVVSLLLLAALIVPFFANVGALIALPPAVLDTAVQGTLDASIQGLRAGDRVLVGFEYGPTAAGELDALAEPLLTHILLRGARPVIVSTSPAGILHARDVLARLGRDPFLLAHLGRPADDPLTMPDDYVILSYLPGGVVGLRSLAAIGTPGALETGLFAVDLNGAPTGLRIRSLEASFKLGLVLAEQGENVRLWVEQIAPAGLPLGAGVTAAAEPLSRPYFQSGQLVGILAGYRDAYTYDRVLLASLPPVYAVEAAPVESTPEGTPADEAATLAATPEAGQDALAFQPTPDAAVATAESSLPAQGLLTNTPIPTGTPEPSATPAPRATRTPVGGAVEAAPTARVFVTATPAPAEGARGGQQPLQPRRTYAAERWYSLTLGALAAALLISLGAVVNILRGLRRRRNS